ncbi:MULTISPECIES: hypothetical protein [unclassified Streptomyces]|uniref:hypothetical protein n=1 Tax=unclassified Streptomyces TaxID=2593676 RepID=UPI000700EBCE|nr:MULTISPECIES: hypothetical protein [unclassified Streptomyces]KQX59473.1 hypothetical protein ASD33_04150 [Streptomyces sp. Root1304]KRB00732.1 hypothetical protein ASE09_04155 [Streptomyces sp. Root66D1]
MRADLRLSLTAVLTAAVLSAATLPALADEAPATPTPIGIGPALTDDAQRGTFRVAAWTDAPQAKVTAVSARVRQGDTVLAEIPALAPGNPWDSQTAGRFLVPSEAALRLTEDGGTIPALGTYAIDVTATDSLGNTFTRTDAGTLDFRLRPRLDTFGVGTPAWDDRNARPTGTLVGVQPGSGDLVPLSGRTVTVAPTATTPGSAVTAVTGDTGAFTGGPLPVADRYASFEASYSEDSAEVHGSVSEYRQVYDVKGRAVQVTAVADKKRALSGEAVTISGRVTDPAAGNAPVADQALMVTLGEYTYNAPYGTTVHTDADGRFSARLIAASGLSDYGDYWTVRSADPYLRFDQVSGAVAVPWETRIDLLTGGLSADGRVSVGGVFRPRYGLGSRSSVPAQYLQLEQSADGKTGWRKIAAAEAYAGYWSTFGLAANSSGGYFRVRHLTSDAYAESSSRVFRLVRTPVRVAGMNSGPEPVRKGAYVATTGTLQHYTSGAWRAFGNVPVALQFQAKGTTTWRQVATGRSAANGWVSLKAKASVDGSWRIRYWGDSTHFHSAAPWADFVDVR